MKVVIAGSASLQNEMQNWVQYWNAKEEHSVTNYPEPIAQDNFDALYPAVHTKFFKDITEADILFIANENKNGAEGYIGAETFAELAFGVAQKLVHNKDIRVIIARIPEQKVASHEEITLWLKLGWIEIHNETI